jgi:ribonuclease D
MALPILRYDGPIHLNPTHTDFRHERIVGFDTETRPTFRKGQSHPPSLVQIATARAVYLFQLARPDCHHVIAELLANSHIVKAGIALNRDLKELGQSFPIEPVNVIELDAVAKRNGFAQTGVRNLAGMFLGGRITKGAQTSNWAAPHLTKAQQTYAATDAWVCRELYLQFEQRGLFAKK